MIYLSIPRIPTDADGYDAMSGLDSTRSYLGPIIPQTNTKVISARRSFRSDSVHAPQDQRIVESKLRNFRRPPDSQSSELKGGEGG